MTKENNLTIVPSVMIWEVDGHFYFDRKFYDGILSYCERWSGTVTLLMRVASTSLPQFGVSLFDPSVFPAKLMILDDNKDISQNDICGANIVLASGDNHRNLQLSALCRQYGVKCVYVIEYIIETRLQIIGMSKLGLRTKLKSALWNLLTEIKRRKAFSLADGLQSNGAPAFNSYKKLVSNSLLYFDSRNRAETNISEEELTIRLLSLDNNNPLRLCFSGRLIKMKGADHLIDVAKGLKKMDIPFSLDIFGAGELSSEMQDKILEYQLEKHVNMRGSVDFEDILLPFIKTNIDLFICCHRQSDPSCTYLETYACGVPIVGYANRAHQEILDQVDVGWSSPINDIKALTNKIAHLNFHREEIKHKAINARKFSAEHSFEKTFSRRIEQCSMILKGR